MEKQKKNFFSNHKKMIKISLVLYIVIAVIITGSSFAWFLANQRVEIAPPDDISITADSRVELSTDGVVWGSTLQMTPNITQFADVSGDGVHFWFPKYLNDNDEVDLSNKDGFEFVNTAIPEKSDPYFITLRLKVRATAALDLYLDGTIGADGKSASYVAPKQLAKVEGEDGSLVFTRPSPLNPEITADYIAAAARVAFIEVVDGTEVLKSLWIPNDKTELYYDENGLPQINTAGQREDYSYLRLNGDQMEQYTYSTDELLSGTIIFGNPQSRQSIATADGTVPPTVGMNKPILSFDGSQIEEKELLIRIWIEGTDREANAALNGGDILYKFAFAGISKGTPAEQELTYTAEGLFYGTNEATDLMYSTNGIDWDSYSNDTLQNVSLPNEFYVRKKETVAFKPGVIYRVNKTTQAVTPVQSN